MQRNRKYMNYQQRHYALAKARLESLEDQQAANERQFMRENGYLNADGSVPDQMYQYDNDDKFDQCCMEFDVSPLNLYDRVKDAEAELYKAENELIEYGLSVMPECLAQQRETLRRNMGNPKIRKDLIDTTFRLDTSTVPAGRR